MIGIILCINYRVTLSMELLRLQLLLEFIQELVTLLRLVLIFMLVLMLLFLGLLLLLGMLEIMLLLDILVVMLRVVLPVQPLGMRQMLILRLPLSLLFEMLAVRN